MGGQDRVFWKCSLPHHFHNWVPINNSLVTTWHLPLWLKPLQPVKPCNLSPQKVFVYLKSVYATVQKKSSQPRISNSQEWINSAVDFVKTCLWTLEKKRKENVAVWLFGSAVSAFIGLIFMRDSTSESWTSKLLYFIVHGPGSVSIKSDVNWCLFKILNTLF